MRVKKCLITFLVGCALLTPCYFTSCAGSAGAKGDKTKTEDVNPDNPDDPSGVADPSGDDDPADTEKKDSDDDKKADDTKPGDDKKTKDEEDPVEEASVSGITLSQETESTLTKSKTGYTFTAPTGYEKYEWTLKGKDIGDLPRSSDSSASNKCSPVTDDIKAVLIDGEIYRIEVKVYNASNELQNIFSYDFQYEEEK